MTHKKIFISRDSLNLGRNRSQRILEASLDNLSRTSTIPKKESKIDCPHYDYCSIKNFGRINCLFDYTQCQTYKFYKKYPNYDQMYIGSKL